MSVPQLPKAAAKEVAERYYGKPALFLEEMLGMELDGWQRELCDLFHTHDRFAVASGHSSGKSALTAGLIQYFIAVHPDPQIIVTANTQQQLREKTWRELAKWHNKSLVKDWFQWTATQFALKDAPETWFASAVPNTPHSSESFAGAHEKYMLQIFDEASAIDQIIWEVAEGATPKPGGYRKWIVFGNPTRNDGAFFQCFHRMRHRWHCMQLDTRQCRYADQKQIGQWAEDYGEDSDFFRVRVLGQFPHQSVVQLIGPELANGAAKRAVSDLVYQHAPKIISCDVARFGDDMTVITRRQGLKVWPQVVFAGASTMEVANRLAQEHMEWNPQAIVVDETGLGAGVVDRLRQLNVPVLGFNGAGKPDDSRYLNRRIESWARMAGWLESADIPADDSLLTDLTGPEYFYTAKGQMQLEGKDSMKRRGLSSPDRGDSLAMSFAFNIAPTVSPATLTDAERDWRKVSGYDEANSVAVVLED